MQKSVLRTINVWPNSIDEQRTSNWGINEEQEHWAHSRANSLFLIASKVETTR